MTRNHLRLTPLFLSAILAMACGEEPATDTGAETVTDTGTGTGTGTVTVTGTGTVTDTDTVTDAGTDPDTAPDTAWTPFQPGPKPTARLWPVHGEVWILQIGVDSFLPKMGEAAIVVGPDGTIVLIDVGNDKHAKQVRKLVEALNTDHLTPANGYAKRSKRQVEWLLLTHWHADHVGGAEELLDGDDKLSVVGGVIHRGWVDVSEGTNAEHWSALCNLLRGKLSKLDKGLCVPAKLPGCDLDDIDFDKVGHYPATHCDHLALGALGDTSDDAGAAPTYLKLGSGARLTLLAADTWLGGGVIKATGTKGWDENNHENARSLVGMIQHGDFRYHFGGDLTGAGTSAAPDVETPLVAHVAPKHWHLHGVDVVHSHHHARKTSNNQALADALAPKDGRSRNVVAGVSKLHLGSPQDEVVERWTGKGRLGTGRLWTTYTTLTGAKPKDFAAIIDADGDVVTRTVQGGVGYWMQAPETGTAMAFESVRHVK